MYTNNTVSKEKQRKTQKLPAGVTVRKDGRYQGRFTVDGKRYTFYDRDLKILKKKLSDAKYELEHGINGNTSKLTLTAWFQIWMKEYKAIAVKKSTLLLYTTSYDRYICTALGKKQLTSIRTIHIQKLYNDLKNSGLSSGTIQIVHSILSNMFTQAIQNDIIMKNPCKGAVIPKGEKKNARVLTCDEQYLFLQSIEGNFYQPLYILALATGLRIGELAALTWEDIDLNARTLTVRRTLLYQKDMDTGRFCFRFQTPKSQTSRRIIPLLPTVADMMADHQIRQTYQKQISCWNPANGMDNLVFTTKNGTPIQESYIIKRLELITRRMNDFERDIADRQRCLPNLHEKITPHSLRHSFATRAFENGLPPKIVQELLGHSTLTLTMDLYTHVTEDIKTKEMSKLAILFE